MQAWLESVAGPGYAVAVMWTLLALLVLVLVLVIIRLIKGMNLGTFVAGGRNRKTRLAVMDATAVDSQRRLILVRRDDIEHLILIGGPTDVVVEQNIRLIAPTRRSGHEDHVHAESVAELPPAPAAPIRAPEPQPAPQRPAAAASAAAYRPAAPLAPAPSRPAEPRQPPPVAPAAQQPPRPQPAPAAHTVGSSYGSVSTRQPEPAGQQVRTLRPVMPPVSATAAPAHHAPVVTAPESPAPRPTTPVQPATVPAAATVAPVSAVAVGAATSDPAASQRDLDSALLEELEVSLERESRSAPELDDSDLDEEMSKLLSDLSGQKP